jgi:hypothetical protein
MMTFSEFVKSMQKIVPNPLRLTHATSSSFASPGIEDTKRAIERATKRGRFVTPDDLKRAISPESQQTANQGVLSLSATLVPRKLGSTPRMAKTLG